MEMGDTMSDYTAVIDRFVELWNEDVPSRQRAATTETFTEDAAYVAPLVNAEGQDGIDALAAELQTRLPGFTFHRTSELDVNHDFVRYNWAILPPGGGGAFADGIDIGRFSTDGRLDVVIAFFDKAPVLNSAPHR